MSDETKSAVQAMRAMFAGAATGPLLLTSLVPLTNQGNLRITYNWLYSALNCDPNDSSSFSWTISYQGSGWTGAYYALSPSDGYNGMTLYASVRDDDNWFVQVQAPYSADWITAADQDELLVMVPQGLNIVQFQSYKSGQNIAVNQQITGHDDHSGYRLQGSGAGGVPQSALWFMGVTQVLQSGPQVRLASEMTPDDIRRAYASCGLTASDDDVTRMMKSLAKA